MKIGIDNISPGLSTGKQTLGGMLHFLQDLATQLPAHGRAHEFKLFSPTWSDPLDAPLAPNLKIVACPNVPRARWRRVLCEQLSLPEQIRQEKIDVWLGTSNVLPQRLKTRSVLLVQSLQYFTHPQAYPLSQLLYLRAFVPRSLRKASAVITWSLASKAEVTRRFGIAPDKVTVVHHAVPRALERLDIIDADTDRQQVAQVVGDKPYILCVSSFYPYKNLFRLIEAFARLKPEYPHKLMFIGTETRGLKKDALFAYAERLGVRHDVLCLGRVPHDEIAKFYRHAALMAMPSLDETFGFPVLEAMALGCPVVTSNVSSMPEITGEAAVLVNPYDVQSIADGMRRLLSDPNLRHSLAQIGCKRARLFTQERMAKQILHVLEAAGKDD